jgi:TRAP-type mannitol/chloroaromatic compound transport system permease small subunit
LSTVKKFFSSLDRVIERLIDWSAVLSGILILIMGFSSTYATARRYVFKSPEPYSYEINMILLMACVVLVVGAVQMHRRQIRVDFISNRFSEGLQDFLINVVGGLMGLFVIVLLIWKSWDTAWYSFTIGETSQSVWREPLFPIKVIVPIGASLLFLVLLSQFTHGVINMVKRIRKIKVQARSSSQV